MNGGTRLTFSPETDWTITWYSGFQDTGFRVVKDSDPQEMENKWSESHNYTGSLPIHILGRGRSRWSTAVSLSRRNELGVWGGVCYAQGRKQESYTERKL